MQDRAPSARYSLQNGISGHVKIKLAEPENAFFDVKRIRHFVNVMDILLNIAGMNAVFKACTVYGISKNAIN